MTKALAPELLSARQRSVYDAILHGPRGADSPFALVADDGTLLGPFGLMVRFPRWGGPLQSVGAALRFESVLPDRVREVVILTVAAVMDSPFEIAAHTAAGAAAGLRAEEIAAILRGEFRSTDRTEQVAAELALALLADASDEVSCAVLGDEEAAEVVVLVGYYRLIAQLMHQFDTGEPVLAP